MSNGCTNLHKSYQLSKLWNHILSRSDELDLKPKSTCSDKSSGYIDLDNYAFRMDMIISKHTALTSNEKWLKILDSCGRYIKKNSSLNAYIQNEKKKVDLFLSTTQLLNDNYTNDQDTIEILELSENIDLKNKASNKDTSAKITTEDTKKVIEQTDKNIELNKNKLQEDKIPESLDSNNSKQLLIESLTLFKKCLRISENDEDLKNLLIEISNKLNGMSLKILCHNLIEIESFNETDLKENFHEVNLKENDVNTLFTLLIDINSSSTILPFNFSFTFLRYILSDYVSYNMNPALNHQASKVNSILSRKMFQLCSSLCKVFPNQFILSCLILWLMQINENQIAVSSSKIYLEFILKLIKECFGESEAIFSLECLLNNDEYSKKAWSENVYSAVSAITEIININSENLSKLLGKMQFDSNDLAKSTIFSKLTLTILNKFKANFSQHKQSNESYQVAQSNQLEYQASSSKLIEMMSLIIQNNQTIMKKSLLNLFNSFNKS